MKIPSDLERTINFMKNIGWTPVKGKSGEIQQSNGTFYVNMERIPSAKIHIEYDDYWTETEEE